MIHYKRPGVTVFHSVLYQTTSTIVETPDLVLIVDPNWLPNEIGAIRQVIEQGNTVKPQYLLFTHAHFDHILGYRAFPGALTIGSLEMEHLQDKAKVIEKICEFDSQYYIERHYPLVFPQLDTVVKTDGQQLVIGETRLTFYLAPGHSLDGLFTMVEPGGIFLAGDYLSDVEFPFIYESSDAYLASMAKVEKLLDNDSRKLLVPGHGSVTDDLTEIRRRIQESRTYILTLKDLVGFELTNKTERTMDDLIEKYTFVQGLRGEHQANIKKLHSELA